MCETEMHEGCYGDPLSLLKNCDAAALGKLCEAVTSMADDTVAYANFPKRSLVKCFSARNKYEWHLTQKAELEDLEKRWMMYKQQTRRTKTRRQQITQDCKKEVDSAEGVSLRRQESPETIAAGRRCLSPLVDEDILREALVVAEHFELSEESELPSPLSSDHKSSTENKVNDERDVNPNITAPQQKPSSHIFPAVLQTHRPQPGERRVERQMSPLTPQVRGDVTASRRRLNATPKGASETPCTRTGLYASTKRSSETPRKRSGISSDRILRGAFGGCLGSKHASVDFTSPRKRDQSVPRRASAGPSRKLFGGNRLKKTGSCRLDHDGGSFGSMRFRSPGRMKASAPRVWR